MILTSNAELSEKSRNHQMGGKKKKALLRSLKNHDESFKKLQDFTSNANWDEFYTVRGVDDSFEWYAEWSQFEELLVKNLLWLWKSPESDEPRELRLPEKVRILVPGCGNSNLSARLYDIGFWDILNTDFSKVVITNMMRRNLRERPKMKWRVDNMALAKLNEASIDAVVDKGLLDALMDPVLNPHLGNLYLIEVKRILTQGGKFICFTLAESHVIDVLFHKFRYGWKVSLHTIAKESASAQQIFALVAEKDSPTYISEISSYLVNYSVESHGEEARELFEALEREREIRINTDPDKPYSLEDLIQGAKGNIRENEPGRRIKFVLGEPGVTMFTYSCVLYDANLSREGANPYSVLVIPNARLHNYVRSSEERQWAVVTTGKAARILMVFLDSSNYIFPLSEIKKDVSRLVGCMVPSPIRIPYFIGDKGIGQRDRLYEVLSELTGPIIVEDVTYRYRNEDGNAFEGPKYRRLIFGKTENLVQSEALLSTKEKSSEAVKEAPKSKKKGKQPQSDSGSHASSGETEVDLSLLASGYHNGIISGIHLISSYLSKYTAHGGDLVKTVVIGLGAGFLPMFMKNHLPTHKIEVVEIDPVIPNIAKEFFGFRTDEHLKVVVKDGVKFVKEMASSMRKAADSRGRKKQVMQEESSSRVDILIVDANSSNIVSGLISPEAGFVDESFLLAAKESLSERGVFVINLITRTSSVRRGVYSRLKTVFGSILCLKIDGDFNEVIFALKTECPFEEEKLSQTREFLAVSLEDEKGLDFSKPIEPLR